MAYHGAQRLVSASSFHTTLDGVPMKLGDNWQPPPKIVLPRDLQTGNPSEILFLEYDFELEEKVIEWTEAERTAQEERERARIEQVGEAIEEFTQVPASEEPTVEEENVESDASNVAPSQPPVPAQATSAFLNMGSDILMPTPIAPTNVIQSDVKPPSIQGSSGSFDLADFENVQDPFENLELKVLNDREELNQMLSCAQAVPAMSQSMPEPPVDQCPSSTMTQSATESVATVPNVSSAGQLTTDAASVSAQSNGEHPVACTVSSPGNPQVTYMPSAGVNIAMTPAAPAVSTQVAGGTMSSALYTASTLAATVQSSTSAVNSSLPPIAGNTQVAPMSLRSLQDVDYPDIESISSGAVSISGSSARYQPPAGPQYSAYSAPNAQYFPQRMAANVNYGNTQSMNASMFSPSGSAGTSAMPATSLPPLCSSGYLVNQQQGYSQYTQAGAQQRADFSHIYAKPNWKDYSAHGGTPNGLLPNLSTRTSLTGAGQPPVNSYPLRSSKSTPDITQLADSQAMSRLISSRTPPPTSSRSRPNTPPATYDQMSAYPTNHAGQSNPQSSNPSLPDPYTTLSRDQMRFVDNITDMGFPRPRVARVVKRCGCDDKQVLDFLCLVNRLSENGYSADDVEQALEQFNQREDQVSDYLKLLGQFKELGFAPQKIQEALISSDLDEEKTLDILTCS